jgi:putative acetyltransferase
MILKSEGNTSIAPYQFRRANNQDAEEVRNIVFAALESYGLPMDPAATDVDLYDIEKYYSNGNFWVFTDAESKICGSFALYDLGDSVAEIRKMYFKPETRGKGLGKWAMEFLISYAKQIGVTKLQLETASVLKEAIQLYLKYGFIQYAGDVHSYRCDVLMKLDL